MAQRMPSAKVQCNRKPPARGSSAKRSSGAGPSETFKRRIGRVSVFHHRLPESIRAGLKLLPRNGSRKPSKAADTSPSQLGSETFRISEGLRNQAWGGRRGLNPQRPEPQSGALPIELLPPFLLDYSNWGECCQKGRESPAERQQKRLVAADADVFESHGAQSG